MDYLIKADNLPFKIEDTQYGQVLLCTFVMESKTKGFIASSNDITKEDLKRHLCGNEKGELVVLSISKDIFRKLIIKDNKAEEIRTPLVSEESINELGREFFESIKDKLTMDQLGKLYPKLQVNEVLEDLASSVVEMEEVSSLEMFMMDIKMSDYREMTLDEFTKAFSYTFELELLEDYGFNDIKDQ